MPQLTPIDLTHTFEEGMARLIGMQAFGHSKEAKICWHCQGERVCSCAGCVGSGGQVNAKCGACLGAGLLAFYD